MIFFEIEINCIKLFEKNSISFDSIFFVDSSTISLFFRFRARIFVLNSLNFWSFTRSWSWRSAAQNVHSDLTWAFSMRQNFSSTHRKMNLFLFELSWFVSNSWIDSNHFAWSHFFTDFEKQTLTRRCDDYSTKRTYYFFRITTNCHFFLKTIKIVSS
jgi:hypothetical protein